MTLVQIAILAVVQGFAELLPVSSSAHVILAQRLMGLDPGAPEMTFLIVMLHTGTMFAVLAYFWGRWRAYLAPDRLRATCEALVIATAATGVLGLALKFLIEKVILEHYFNFPKGEVEHLFRVLPLISAALASAGLLIIWAGSRGQAERATSQAKPIDRAIATKIGLVQGLCLPFRGFSRSGATISTGMLLGVSRAESEDFSFALAVIVTPPVLVLQIRRLLHAHAELGAAAPPMHELFLPGLVGMVFAAVAGWFALKWLSAWLERGRWKLFGYYCLGLSALMLGLWLAGF